MGQYLRAFCTATVAPPLHSVLGSLADAGLGWMADARGEELRSREWDQVKLRHPDSGRRLLITCDCDDDPSGQDFVREQIEEFIEFVQGAASSPGRKRVLHHLRSTKFIVACEIAAGGDPTSAAVGRAVLSYFVRECGGLVQIDGEGFFDGDRLLLPAE